MNKPPPYIRKERYELHDLLSLVELHHTKADIVIFDGDPIKLGSDRYKLFKTKGTVCAECGIVGTFFAKERTFTKKTPKKVSWHMNLYAIAADGTEVLMTKDHIYPKSLGGKDELENYQPMCHICNSKKGHKIIPIG
jgi:5-methylcytosine-specific restriction endonuclease McrA